MGESAYACLTAPLLFAVFPKNPRRCSGRCWRISLGRTEAKQSRLGVLAATLTSLAALEAAVLNIGIETHDKEEVSEQTGRHAWLSC